MGHHWHEFDLLKTEFDNLSGWLSNPTGDPNADPYSQPGADLSITYQLSGDKLWWYDQNAIFASDRGKLNPDEDIAEVFKNFIYEEQQANPPTDKLDVMRTFVESLIN